MRDAVGKSFERLGGSLIDPATILTAALPLDLCGESVRARLCVFTDHNNRDLALRPDLTLPVALQEIEARKAGTVQGERVHRYNARAFRQPIAPGEPLEFLQVGFERFGTAKTAEVDAEAYVLVSEAAVDAGVADGMAKFGDLSVLPAFIDALDLSDAISAGLRRAFREEGGVTALLERVSRPADDFIIGLQGLDREDVTQRLNAHLAEGGTTHFGDRTQDEVVTRIMEQARDANRGAVSDIARQTLEAVLQLRCAPDQAARALRDIASRAEISDHVETIIGDLQRRWDIIANSAPQFLVGADFSPSFGRRFTYYDGFVFEIAEAGERQSRPFGAGGRYDRLLADLSRGAVSATAIGGVVRPDRLELARTAEAGS